MLRGWTTPYKGIAERRQHDMLIEAGVQERAIYPGKDWAESVRALRPGDEAVVADLRVFGSRKRLGAASAAIVERGATLVTAAGTRIHHPTLADVQRTESLWNKQRSMGGSKRAKTLSAKGIAERKRRLEASRLARPKAEAVWFNSKRYPLVKDALAAMPGWTYMMAYRAFGGREKI